MKRTYRMRPAWALVILATLLLIPAASLQAIRFTAGDTTKITFRPHETFLGRESISGNCSGTGKVYKASDQLWFGPLDVYCEHAEGKMRIYEHIPGRPSVVCKPEACLP